MPEPCPFCGHEPAVEESWDGFWAVMCAGDCFVRPFVRGKTREEALDRWDTRLGQLRERRDDMEPNGVVSDARGTVEVGGDLTDTDAVFLAWMVKNVVNDMDGRWDVRIEVTGGYGDE